MGLNSGNKYTHYAIEATELILPESDLDVNTKSGAKRISLEMQELIGNGQLKLISQLRDENKMLKQNLISI